MIIEQAYIDMKEGKGERYAEMFPHFKELFMTLPGAVSARLLRDQKRPDTFVAQLQWESQEARDIFVADPRRKPWSAEFRPMVEHETISFFDEIAPD